MARHDDEIPGPNRSQVMGVDRKGDIEAPEATFVIHDLGELPDLLRS